MRHESVIDEATGRKFYLDVPDDTERPLTFLLNLHGGGSFGAWQRLYFPAHDYADAHALVIAAPTAATAEPSRHWVAEADDEHLQNVVNLVAGRFGDGLVSFWLVGHSQGGMTSRRLLDSPFFADRADGWLSLSGGRIGGVPRADGAGAPSFPGGPRMSYSPERLARLRAGLSRSAGRGPVVHLRHRRARDRGAARRVGLGGALRCRSARPPAGRGGHRGRPGLGQDPAGTFHPAVGAAAPAGHRARLHLPRRAGRPAHRRRRPPGQGPYRGS